MGCRATPGSGWVGCRTNFGLVGEVGRPEDDVEVKEELDSMLPIEEEQDVSREVVGVSVEELLNWQL